jgi:hypothetical protein
MILAVEKAVGLFDRASFFFILNLSLVILNFKIITSVWKTVAHS